MTKGWNFMRQYSYALHNAADIPKAIAYFKQCYTPEGAEGFFSVTTPLNTPAWISQIQQAFSDAFPETPLAGMTTASSIQGGYRYLKRAKSISFATTSEKIHWKM